MIRACILPTPPRTRPHSDRCRATPPTSSVREMSMSKSPGCGAVHCGSRVLIAAGLFVAQRLNGIEAGCPYGRDHAADQPHQCQDKGRNQHAYG